MTSPTGRRLVDYAMTVEQMDERGLRVAMNYLIGASARAFAVRKAFESALDAAAGDAQRRADGEDQETGVRGDGDFTEFGG